MRIQDSLPHYNSNHRDKFPIQSILSYSIHFLALLWFTSMSILTLIVTTVVVDLVVELTVAGHSHKVVFINLNVSTHEKITAQTSTMAQGCALDLRELLDWRSNFR